LWVINVQIKIDCHSGGKVVMDEDDAVAIDGDL
jgi:hypothetical protein